LQSQQRTAAAQAAGLFDAEIVPLAARKQLFDKEGNPTGHEDVIATKDIAVGEIRRLDCEGRGLFVYRDTARSWKVYDSRCPHQTTNIPHLALQDCTLTCPKHEWQFDIRTGEARRLPACVNLRIHAAKLTRWERFFSDIPIYFGKPCYGLWGHMGITWSH